MPSISTPLPIDEVLPGLRLALGAESTVILRAEPGAGKTTRVPLALLDEEWLQGRSILVLEPRRLAAHNAARFMARNLGEEVGETVGYTVRYQRRTSRRTRVEVVTEGILTRRLQRDPELAGVGLVIFDEFHERNLQSDLALAFCRDVQTGLRDDLKLLVMSATLDATALAELLDDPPLIDCPGRQYPITLHYQNQPTAGRLIDQLARLVVRAAREQDGDLLVFLPGAGEIRQLETALAGWARSENVLLTPLYGQLDFSAQQRAILPAAQRKVVLATNIAETSLTIEGIKVVVDSGLERRPRFDSGSGTTRLDKVRISRSSARQRAGRAGRLGPGACYRLWTQGEEGALLEQTPPEIRQADLAPLCLELAAWGISDASQLAWLDPPSSSALAAARSLLSTLGALDKEGRLTDVGRRMSGYGCHPRLARLLVAAVDEGLSSLGCELVALLSEIEGLRMQTESSGRLGCDVCERLEKLTHAGRGVKGGFERAARYWRRQLSVTEGAAPIVPGQVAELLAVAYPDRIARRRNEGSAEYQLASGQGVGLRPTSMARDSEWLVAVDIHTTLQAGEITIACSLDSSVIERLCAMADWQREVRWDEATGRVSGLEVRRLGALVLQQRPITLNAEEYCEGVLGLVRKKGLKCLGWSAPTLRFRARVRLLERLLPTPEWQGWDDAWLLDHLEEWLAPFLGKVRSLQQLRSLNLLSVLEARLDYQQRQQLQVLAPEQIEVPSGRKARIDYVDGDDPVLAVKLQELFGLQESPRIAGGRLPLVVQLLSPAGRPLQVTRDLRSFWQEGYPEVRKEMRGRYPKHPWPDDPLTAEATAATKRKKR